MIRAERLWVFNGARGTFPGGIFTDLDRAEHWIEEHRLTGTLTAYPLFHLEHGGYARRAGIAWNDHSVVWKQVRVDAGEMRVA